MKAWRCVFGNNAEKNTRFPEIFLLLIDLGKLKFFNCQLYTKQPLIFYAVAALQRRKATKKSHLF
jgi:hypothetical protein